MRPIFTLLFLLFGSTIFGQSINLHRADEYMQDLDYMSAILLYLQILQNNDVEEAKINLAECYRKINDTENAEYWYAQALKVPNPKPIHKLYYAMMLQANGKSREAKPWVIQYLKDFPDDARGQFLLKACDQEQNLKAKNRDVYTVYELPINSNLDDFSPAIVGSQLIFASDRDRGTFAKRTSMWTGNPFSDLYVIDIQMAGQNPGDFRYKTLQKFSKDVNTKYNEAAVAVSPDHKTLYFTRNNYLDGKTGRSEDDLVKLKIFAGQKDPSTNAWTNIQDLPFNSSEFHTAFPTLSPDGNHLYFSSNKPGGYGGMDLYVSNWEETHWGAPINLGSLVNTEGNEIFPCMTSDNRLYFSSNGHIGLGGQDIFYTQQSGAGPDNWNMPINLGSPINSNRDEIGITFSSDLTWGFFTSDRDNGAGRDDIYAFQKHAMPVELLVLDANGKTPLQGVSISSTKSGLAISTGKDGKVSFDMRYADCLEFGFVKKGYENYSKQICTSAQTDHTVFIDTIEMHKQFNFTVQGIVFDMTDGLPAEGARVMLLNDCGKPIPDAVLTNDNGRYKFKLEKACTYTVQAVHDGYIAAKSEPFTTIGLQNHHNFRINLNLQPYSGPASQESETLPHYNPSTQLYENNRGEPANMVLAEGMELKNGILYDNETAITPNQTQWQRSATGYLINLYYDFNQTQVSNNSMPELTRLYAMLQENPEISIEIASHTDARGSDAYNLQLSQERAESVVSWLSEKGIAKERLRAKGYGETQLVNHCGDDVNCTEAQHAMNRRTEFRILGKNGIIVSQPKKEVRVAPCAGCPF
ncbi:MAG: PD40 domain-containing protein [Bacteroidetes bacterium]|nr:PD40 domain-containing protein [Bacteroidota bacterium]